MRKGVVVTILIGILIGIAVGSLWEAQPRIGAHEDGTEAELVGFGNIQKYVGGQINPDWPTGATPAFPALVNWSIECTCARASGDMDTKDPEECGEPDELVADSLKAGWPMWSCTMGHFEENKISGTSVVWVAPSTPSWPNTAHIQIWEKDVALPIPPGDTGSRNDATDPLYGAVQGGVEVEVLQLEVECAVATSGNVSANPATYDAFGLLGLWWTNDTTKAYTHKKAFAIHSEKWPSPDDISSDPDNLATWTTNGTSNWPLDGGNAAMRVGSGLKAEIRAKHDKHGLPYEDWPEFCEEIENPDNWRFVQKKRGHYWLNGAPKPFQPETYDTGTQWVEDGDGYFYGTRNNVFFDVESTDSDLVDRFYMGDAPSISCRSTEGYQDEDVFEKDVDYATWLAFKHYGRWQKVTSPPTSTTNPEPMWGVTIEVKMVDGHWSTTRPATAKTY